MRYLWAFNHDESSRSFAKAAELDPNCAMCWWGPRADRRPNYNVPFMAEPRAKVAFESVEVAQKSAEKAQPVEQALIAALASVIRIRSRSTLPTKGRSSRRTRRR